MSTFFQQTAQTMIAKHIDLSPFIETGANDQPATNGTLSEPSENPLPPTDKARTSRNEHLLKTRYVVEKNFGTLHRKFRYAQAAYFVRSKVMAQSKSDLFKPVVSSQQATCV
ncbi:putative transposase for IS1106A3 [Neisseria animaloris]|nr:putative transposase for IS1106A3 [Neisseria animaloris]